MKKADFLEYYSQKSAIQYFKKINFNGKIEKSSILKSTSPFQPNLTRAIANKRSKSKIVNLQSKIYNLAGSTHLKTNDSCGMTILSEILAILAGNFIK